MIPKSLVSGFVDLCGCRVKTESQGSRLALFLSIEGFLDGLVESWLLVWIFVDVLV